MHEGIDMEKFSFFFRKKEKPIPVQDLIGFMDSRVRILAVDGGC